MKALIYSRCSTDEKKQDLDVQIQQLIKYCNAYGYEYEIVSEYGSGYKGHQPELEKAIERIRLGEFNMLIVYSMDRFSREHPRKVNDLLNKIVYDYKCRFFALLENIDSNNEMVWLVMKHMFIYFAHVYSRNLSEKVKAGIDKKKADNKYFGGRKRKSVNVEHLKEIYDRLKSLRKTAEEYNKDKTRKDRISYVSVKNTLSDLYKETINKNES